MLRLYVQVRRHCRGDHQKASYAFVGWEMAYWEEEEKTFWNYWELPAGLASALTERVPEGFSLLTIHFQFLARREDQA